MSRFRRGQHALIYGHRGVRGEGLPPENTMAAFIRAKDEGADGIELDVRQAASGEVVVFHDPTLRRMTSGFDSRALSALPLDELRRIDLSGEPIPTLHDVLDWIEPTGLLLNVEMKRDLPSRTGLVIAVAKILRAHTGMRERLLVSSFDPVMLAGLAPLLPRIPRGLLFHAGQAAYKPWRYARHGPWQAAHPEHVMVSDEEMKLSRDRIVNAWTVNDAGAAQRLDAMGVDGIISDRPGAIRAALAAPSAATA
ncbi:MAG: glycerophosphodiester phosphodiesterase [Deltaproteobacteria bacterium]|nr:glycerophosphodiester phosphodiesterase [Deltaproteobacteria bacterium]